MKLVVSDCSPLYGLFQIGLLPHLVTIDLDVHVPEAVWSKLVRPSSERQAIDASALTDLTVHRVTDRAAVDVLMKSLDPGEAEAIALAAELRCDTLLIDEMKGRKEATRRGYAVVGLVGVLRRMKRYGLIPRIAPFLVELRQQHDFWISQALIDAADNEP